MGLSLSVGIFADLDDDDAEAANDFAEYFSFAGSLLERAGLPKHVEPSEGQAWGAQMYGYSGLHYLRRIAAHLDAGLSLPPPGDDRSSRDPVLKAYFADVLGEKAGWVQRLFRKRPRFAQQPRFARSFDHLIVHSDAEGFYLPQDFDRVIFADAKKLPGGALGSVPRLLAELERLAEALGVPGGLHARSEELWQAADCHGEGEALWQRYGIESYSCVVLREACRRSLASGAAIVFC